MAKTGGGVIDGLFAFNNVNRIRRGGGAPALQMADDLGSRVHYGVRVSRIVQNASAVEVVAESGEVWAAKYAVVTGAPSVVNKIVFDPPLPSLKEQVIFPTLQVQQLTHLPSIIGAVGPPSFMVSDIRLLRSPAIQTAFVCEAQGCVHLAVVVWQVMQSVPMGNAVRVSAVYSWPWWRSQGLSGAWGDEMDGS